MAKTMNARPKREPRTKPGQPAARVRRWVRGSIAVCVLGFSLMALALVHVWLRLQVVHMGYVLSSTSKLQHQIEQENRELKVELATLTSPDRLEATARRRLGLIPPEKGQIIILP